MPDREWAFLLDENVDPKVGELLDEEGFRVVHVQEALSKGADDQEDILPFAREEDLVLVTSDVTDFGKVASSRHRGVMLLFDQRTPPHEVGQAIVSLVNAYGSRERFESDALDDWF